MSRMQALLSRRGRSRYLALALVLGLSTGLPILMVERSGAELKEPKGGERRVAMSVATMLQRLHLARRPMDDEMARRCLDSYLKMLDPQKIHFLQSDVDEFMAQRDKIDDQIRSGDIQLSYTIYRRLLSRIDERAALIDQLLGAEHDFTIDEQMSTDPKVLKYPQDETEAKDRWRKRIKFELLDQKADGLKVEEAREKLKRRYHSFAKRMAQMDNDELLEMYLTAMTTGYDPHTTYMSASSLENFEIQMKLELDGIGASLQFDDGYTVVHKIIPGGAAAKDGNLKIKDQIVAVGQGPTGEMVDVVDMKLNDVVKLIRGKRGTIVRIAVKPSGEAQQKIYNITRDRIELKDSEARSEIFTEGKLPDGSPLVVGVINLPSFYMDMAGAKEGLADFKSTTRDVRKILEDFKAKGVKAVIMDLRQNGGGSLTEAVNLTGLFIENGPVVQVKGFDGNVEPYDDRNDDIPWDGPLVVLTSKFSASASEIFAGAIQDYGRGLVVGDKSTHGKGTVQQLLDLGNQIFRVANAPQLGALKITIQQFYRPSGDSTQNRGVISDVELPSLTTHLDVGESDLDYALAFDQVKPVSFKAYNMVNPPMLANLKARSMQRIGESAEFKKVLETIERYKEQKQRKSVMLNEEKFMAERAQIDANKAQEKEIEEMSDPNRPVVKRDFYFNEALAITADYVDQLFKAKVAKK